MDNHETTLNAIERIRCRKSMRAHEKRALITKVTMKKLGADGDFFHTRQGTFYFHRPTRRLYQLEGQSIALSAFLEKDFGINEAERAEYQHLLVALRNHAYRDGSKTEIYRVAHYNLAGKTLYVSRFDGSAFRLDGQAIETIPNGTDGVFFWDDPEFKPYQVVQLEGPTKFSKILLDCVNFRDEPSLGRVEQQFLFEMWLIAQFFDSLHPTKPVALFYGEKGSGKTSALRKWLKVLLGPAADVSALEYSKPDGFIAAVTSQPVVVFDNVDNRIRWLPDHLAQLATGIVISRRELYTTNDSARYNPKCWVALTSRTPDFLNGRDDVLDRTIVFHTDRLLNNVPEHQLIEQVESCRDQLWSELLQQLNRIVAYLRVNSPGGLVSPHRMADFASFVMEVANASGRKAVAIRALAAMKGEQTRMLGEDEPIFVCLNEWLKNPTNHGRDVTSANLNEELRTLADLNNVRWPYSNAQSLGQRLRNIEQNVKDSFAFDTRYDSSRQKHYAFSPKAEALNLPETPNAALPSVQVIEALGNGAGTLNL